MTNQEVKDWLNRGHKLEEEIEAIDRSRAAMYSRAASITPGYNGEAVAGSKNPHKLDGYLEAVERYAELVGGKITELSNVSGEIFRVVYQVTDNNERKVLIERYLNFLTWEQIAVSMNYTYRNVTYIHGRALQSVRKILEARNETDTDREKKART